MTILSKALRVKMDVFVKILTTTFCLESPETKKERQSQRKKEKLKMTKITKTILRYES